AHSRCKTMPAGGLSVQSLWSSCFGQNNSAETAAIAFHESGGNPLSESRSDICQDSNRNDVMVNGKPLSVSIGLFQINISAHKIGALNCPTAFDKMYTGTGNGHNAQ